MVNEPPIKDCFPEEHTYTPKDYFGPLPFDRFGEYGHMYYNPEHSGKYGHYCHDWDGLYICEDCVEFKSCTCFKDLEMTEQDIVWTEEIAPLLQKIVYACAKVNLPIDFKFEITDTADKSNFTICVINDKDKKHRIYFT